eukprot:1259066-Pleurochrysis_carterae.AAC.1
MDGACDGVDGACDGMDDDGDGMDDDGDGMDDDSDGMDDEDDDDDVDGLSAGVPKSPEAASADDPLVADAELGGVPFSPLCDFQTPAHRRERKKTKFLATKAA